MGTPATPDDEASEVLERARVAAARGNVGYSRHALGRMRERGAHAEDVLLAMRGATASSLKDNGTWRLSGGKDVDGDDLDVVLDVRCDPIRVVTIM